MTQEKQWSQYQTAVFAAVAEGTGHLAVKAGPGAGKTTTAVESLKYVPRGKSTFFCAFNRDIANELKARAPQGVEVSTLHSYGLKSVSKAFGRLTVDAQRVRDDLAKRVVGDKREDWELRAALAKCVSLCKATLAKTSEEIDALVDSYEVDIPIEAYAGSSDRRELFTRDVLKLLELSRDVSEGSIDYDDMVWLPVALNLPVWKYDRVFVDETQDLNECQIKLVLGAVKKGGRIVAIGDPRQAIYSFRGAADGAFERVCEALQARVLPLSISYRCARSIVRVAQEIAPELEAAPGAEEGVVRDATFEECARQAAPGDFILSRTNAPLVGLCLRMLREGRRANIQGRDVGATLASFVKKSGAATVDALRRHVGQWRDAEVKRLLEKRRDPQSVEDKALTLMALSDGAATVAEVTRRIESLFLDVNDTARVTLSTTHKAKGLERDRVWLLADTYRKRPGAEEDCIYYVAVTRARKELVMVYGSNKQVREEEVA